MQLIPLRSLVLTAALTFCRNEFGILAFSQQSLFAGLSVRHHDHHQQRFGVHSTHSPMTSQTFAFHAEQSSLLFLAAAAGQHPEESTNPSRATAYRALEETVEKYIGTMSPTSDWKRTNNYLYRNCLGDTILSVKQVDLVMRFLSERLDRDLVRHILQICPRILRKNVETQLKPTWEFLSNIYPQAMLNQALLKKPDLLMTRGLGYQADELNLMQVYLSQELNMKPTQIRKLQNTNGAVLFQLPIHKVLPIVDYLRDFIVCAQSKKDKSIDESKVRETLSNLIARHPQVLQLSLEETLKPRINYLQSRCGLEKQDVAVLLQSSAAGILGLNVERNLGPTLDYLEQVFLCGRTMSYLHEEDKENILRYLKSCILSHPQILGLSLENIKSKVQYFDSLDEPAIDERASYLAARVLQRAPTVFSLSLTNNIIPTVEFLAKIWRRSDYDPTEAASTIHQNTTTTTKTTKPSTRLDSVATLLLGEFPDILTLSLDNNIRPTVSFFNKTGYINLDSQWSNLAVRSDPHVATSKPLLRGRYIASSLHSRLIPRWHYVQEQLQERDGEELKGKENPQQIPLHVLAGMPDPAFCKHFGYSLEDFLQYKKDAIPRLKFEYELESWLNPVAPMAVG